MFRTIDLFAGIGGVRIGFEKAGFTTVFANDFDPYCKITYDLNFQGTKLTVKDVTQINIDDLPDFKKAARSHAVDNLTIDKMVDSYLEALAV